MACYVGIDVISSFHYGTVSSRRGPDLFWFLDNLSSPGLQVCLLVQSWSFPGPGLTKASTLYDSRSGGRILLSSEAHAPLFKGRLVTEKGMGSRKAVWHGDNGHFFNVTWSHGSQLHHIYTHCVCILGLIIYFLLCLRDPIYNTGRVT